MRFFHAVGERRGGTILRRTQPEDKRESLVGDRANEAAELAGGESDDVG